MDSCDARPMHLNPLLSEPCIVNVSDVEVDPDEGIIHFIQKRPKLPRRQQEPLFRAAVLTTDPDLRLRCDWRKLSHGIQTAHIVFVIGDVFSHKPCYHEYRVAT